MEKNLEQVLWENYPRVALDIMAPLLAVLHAARQFCGGDLDKYIILLAISVRVAQHPQFIARAQEQVSQGETAYVPGAGTNVRSLADSLEIPKETVRRKVQELIEAGWVAREDNLLYLTPRTYEEMTSIQEATIKQTARAHQAVERLKVLLGSAS